VRALAGLVVSLTLSACAALPPSFPDGAYYPAPGSPGTASIASALRRAALAAGDDPARFSFARFESAEVAAVNAPDGVFYFSDALAGLPPAAVDALVAHAFAHEALGHADQRRALSLSVSFGFTALGIAVPGLGLVDLVANPLIVRAFTREQHLAADRKAVELLQGMGHASPRRVLATALQVAHRVNGPARWPLLAVEPGLERRLLALEPLEPLADVARARR